MPFSIRKQITARRAYTERRKTLVVSVVLALSLAAALVVLIVASYLILTPALPVAQFLKGLP